MVANDIRESVIRYLHAVNEAGVHASRGVVYGSFARGDNHTWSDIDLVVIAPELDNLKSRELIHKLWILAARTDSRIEPVACGEQEWVTDDSRPILEIARNEGVVIELDGAEVGT